MLMSSKAIVVDVMCKCAGFLLVWFSCVIGNVKVLCLK